MALEIVNIIASARIKGKIDVEKVYQLLPHTEYNPEMFPGLIYRPSKGKPTIILFASGKISSHGARSEKIAYEAIKDVLKEITNLDCVSVDKEASVIEWSRIENVVGTINMNKSLDLKELYRFLESFLYEPEKFPGLIYKPLGNSTTCLVFSTGKMVIVGGKSENQIKEVATLMQNILSKETADRKLQPVLKQISKHRDSKTAIITKKNNGPKTK